MLEENNKEPTPQNAEVGSLGRYQIIAPIAAGGMGEVFLAKAIGAAGFEKKVVIKRIRPHLAQDPAFVRRFIGEGRVTPTWPRSSIWGRSTAVILSPWNMWRVVISGN